MGCPGGQDRGTTWSGIRQVLVVYPYTYVNPTLCLPPLAAEYAQLGALAAGCEVRLLDMRFEDDVGADLERADLVCLYGFFEDCDIFGKWQIHVIDELLAQVPEDVPVVAGGTGFANAPVTLSHYARIDAVLEGVPDIPMQRLLEAGGPVGVENVVYRNGDEIVRNPRVRHDLTEHRFPRRELRDPRYHYHFLGLGADLVRAAQGCNYRCRFCYQFGKDSDGTYLRWQGRSARSQFEELQQVEAPIVVWVDDDMTTDMGALEELADLILAHDDRKVLVGTGRIDHVVRSDVKLLQKLERAGLLTLAFGVESLRPETLRFHRKAQSVPKVEQAMDMMNETNILLVCNFLLGLPGETETDMLKASAFGRRYMVDTLVTNRLRMPATGDYYEAVFDPDTGLPRPGLELVTGAPLKRIKNRVKYGQRSPLRVLLSILKLFRHEGLSIDPVLIICHAIEALTAYTWIEKTRIVPVLLFVPKFVSRRSAWRTFTRATAPLLTPAFIAIYRVTDAVDDAIGLSDSIMPAFFDLFRRKVMDKQKRRAQAVAGRAFKENTPEPAQLTRPPLLGREVPMPEGMTEKASGRR